MSARPGNRVTCDVMLFCSKPPMAKLWPLPSSIVVSARRTCKAGTLNPFSVMAPLAASVTSVLTSGETRMLIRSSFTTVGLKSSATPNRL